MFDLKQNLEAWRVAFLAKSEYTRHDIDEMESHLLAAIDEYKGKELTEEEAFVLASHQLGSAQELRQDFLAANYRKVWLNRLIWILGGYLFFQIINTFGGDLFISAFRSGSEFARSMMTLISVIAGLLYGIVFILLFFATFNNKTQRWLGKRIAGPGKALKTGLAFWFAMPILIKILEFVFFLTKQKDEFFWGWQGASLPHLMFMLIYIGFIYLLFKQRKTKILSA